MTPAEIAARLTPAQKRALLWLPANKATRDEKELPRYTMRAPLYALSQKQLTPDIYAVLARVGPVINRTVYWRLTLLGAEVRAILAAEAQRDE